MDEQITAIVAANTAMLQNHDDRIKQNELVFGESAIIPSKHINAILITFAATVFMICVAFTYAFVYTGY